MPQLQTILELSHQLGREERGFAILGEGNTSTRLDDEFFLVKASGSSLATLERGGLTRCHFNRILPLLEGAILSDDATDEAMLAARAGETQEVAPHEFSTAGSEVTATDVSLTPNKPNGLGSLGKSRRIPKASPTPKRKRARFASRPLKSAPTPFCRASCD